MRARVFLLAVTLGTTTLAAAVLGACDDAFDPLAQAGPAFALFGALDGRTDRQAVRVQAFGEAVYGTPDRLPATVTSTELRSGRTTVWRDSLVTLSDGERAHVFVADLRVRQGEVHLLEAVRERDGARATATVRLPTPVATPGPADQTTNATVRVQVSDLVGRQEVDAVLRYRVRRADGTGETEFTAPATLQPEAGGTSFLAFVAEAQRRAARIYSADASAEVIFLGAQLEVTLASFGSSPLDNAVGEVEWVLPLVVPIPFSAADVERGGFIDGR